MNQNGLFLHIGHKIITAVGVAVTIVMVAMAMFMSNRQEENILAQNERAMRKVAESVIHALETVMLAGYADIAESFAESLKTVPEVSDFLILRADGTEAFLDNQTIKEVNERRGEDIFPEKDVERRVEVFQPDHDEFGKVVLSQELTAFYELRSNGERFLTFLVPILNQPKCYKCHGKAKPVRGVVALKTTLAPIQADIRDSWIQSMIVLAAAITGIMLLTSYMIRRTVVRPITSVSDAMTKVAAGDLKQRVPVLGRDELARMATSFNTMTQEVLKTYTGLKTEQNKLTTIILSAREGMVVTDQQNEVVLVNPAAEVLLKKTYGEIIRGGFEGLFDDPARMAACLAKSAESGQPDTFFYKGRLLSVHASTIVASDSSVVGSAALIRDVTEEKRLEEELRTLSNTDGLTGLFNRRHMDEALALEFERVTHGGGRLAILLFDVDHFKKFNDTYGHDQGDRVLKSIAGIMTRNARETDKPCRYGGEEFLVIMAKTDQEGALKAAERLRREVQDTPVDGLHVTISIGVACFQELSPPSVDAFVSMADKALYQAKKGGRNKVVLATADMAPDEDEQGRSDGGTEPAD